MNPNDIMLSNTLPLFRNLHYLLFCNSMQPFPCEVWHRLQGDWKTCPYRTKPKRRRMATKKKRST